MAEGDARPRTVPRDPPAPRGFRSPAARCRRSTTSSSRRNGRLRSTSCTTLSSAPMRPRRDPRARTPVASRPLDATPRCALARWRGGHRRPAPRDRCHALQQHRRLHVHHADRRATRARRSVFGFDLERPLWGRRKRPVAAVSRALSRAHVPEVRLTRAHQRAPGSGYSAAVTAAVATPNAAQASKVHDLSSLARLPSRVRQLHPRTVAEPNVELVDLVPKARRSS